jgi:RecA-family ATPase
LKEKSGTSGSTAWSNSVRSRLYLDRLKAKAEGEDDMDAEPDIRVLRVMKSNYAPLGNDIRLRWVEGCFRLDGPTGGFDKLAVEAKADRVFLDLVGKFQAEGRDVSPNRSPSFAPTVFAKHPDRSGLSKNDFEAAMNRLLGAKKIQVEKSGSPSKQHSRLVIANGSDD